jgi:hypothetical protein
MFKDQISEWEDFAFYESGLVADGCLEKLDEYSRNAIKKYGEHLLRKQAECFEEHYKDLKKVARKLYGTVLHVHALAKEDPLVIIGPELYKEAATGVTDYEKVEQLNYGKN